MYALQPNASTAAVATRYTPSGDVAGRVIDGEALLVLPALGEAIVLNAVGSRIWELLVESLGMQAVVNHIVEEFEIDPETATRDADDFCADLVRRGFLAIAPEGQS